MIFIDGEQMPSIVGTGSEDYFNHAWGMQRNAFPFFGSIIHEGDVPGCQVSYRFHIADPVRFSKSIKVTMEHGHANHLSDDWSSTAYWYQTLPSNPLTILPVEKRLPIIPNRPVLKREYSGVLQEDMKAAHESYKARFKESSDIRRQILRSKEEKAREESAANIKLAKESRELY